MNSTVHPTIQKQILGLNIDEFCLRWLDDFEKLDESYQRSFTAEDSANNVEDCNMMSLELPLTYARIQHVYYKLLGVQYYVNNHDGPLTYLVI
jgi:hypothetical protein